MKNLHYLVPNGNNFKLSDELFYISSEDLKSIQNIGRLTQCFLKAMESFMYLATTSNIQLNKSSAAIRDSIMKGLSRHHKNLGCIYPHRTPLLTRVDLMIDLEGNWKIAEIDPTNKHGLGFAMACRNESGNSVRQKISGLLSPVIGSFAEVCFLLAEKDEFFTSEQKYFAQWLKINTSGWQLII